MHTNEMEFTNHPPLDSQAGLEARLLRLMEITLDEEQRSRCEADAAVRPLSADQLRRNALSELMLHAEDGYFDHMNSLVKRSAVYLASILAFALCTLLLNQGQFDNAARGSGLMAQSSVPATMHLRSISSWSCD